MDQKDKGVRSQYGYHRGVFQRWWEVLTTDAALNTIVRKVVLRFDICLKTLSEYRSGKIDGL